MASPAQYDFIGDGSTRIFPIGSRIISQEYLKIEVNAVEVIDTTSYDIINNSIVFRVAPADTYTIVIRVVQAIEDIPELDNLTVTQIVADNIEDVTDVASNIESVNTVAQIEEEIDDVAGMENEIVSVADEIQAVRSVALHMPEVVSVSDNTGNIEVVAENIDEVQTVADDIDKIAPASQLIVLQTEIEQTQTEVEQTQTEVEQTQTEVEQTQIDIEVSETLRDSRLDALEIGQSAGTIGFITKALMDADIAHVEGTVALVTNDPTPANNGTYLLTSGVWNQSSYDRVALVEQDVSELSVEVAKGEGLKEAFIQSSLNLFDKFAIDNLGYYTHQNEYILSSTVWSSGLFPVTPGAQYVKNVPNNYITYYDIDGVFIQGTSFSEIFIVPTTANIALCRIAFLANDQDSIMLLSGTIMVQEYIPFHTYFVDEDKLDVNPNGFPLFKSTQIDGFLRDSINLFIPEEINQLGWINTGDTLLTNNLPGTIGSTRSTGLMPCTGGLAYTRTPHADTAIVGWYDSNKDYITQNSISTSASITAPIGSAWMMWTVDNAFVDTIMIVEGASISGTYVPYWYYKLAPNVLPPVAVGEIAPSRWVGATYNAIGDSITIGATVLEAEAFPSLLGDAKAMGVVNNYGVVSLSLTAMATLIPTYDATAGLVTLFGGTNDWDQDIPLGVIGDTTTATFYGALYVACTNLLATFPLASIAIFTPLHRSIAPTGLEVNTNGDTFLSFVEAIQYVSRQFSIPLLDLYSMSGIKDSTFLTDGLHPNVAGHSRLATRIGSFIETI